MSLWRYAVQQTLARPYSYKTNTGWYSSYRSLTPKTRALFGVGLMAWASLGLWFSPQIENAMGMVPSAEEKEELERKLALRVSRVEKGN
ncbi:hypothetical protein V6Z94_000855 [Aspergillus fumigatus]|jgi:hypothetical protein